VRFDTPQSSHDSERLPVDAVDPYKQEVTSTEATGLARLSSSNWWDKETKLTLWVVPVYFDAVNAKKAVWDGEEHSYLKPGTHEFVAHVASGSLSYTYVRLYAQLAAGRQYKATGRFDYDTLQYWIEDVASGRPAGPVSSVHIGRPSWLPPTAR
jgi:hypothetical protein